MKNGHPIFYLIFLMSWFYPEHLLGQLPVLSFEREVDRDWPQSYMEVLQSEYENDDVTSILNHPQKDWIPVTELDIEKLSRVSWCRFSIYNPEEKSLSLALSYRFIVDTVSLYVKTSEGLQLNATNGFYFPHNDREINSWMSYFLMEILPQDTLEWYTRVVVEKPENRINIFFPILEKSHFIRQDDTGEAAFQFGFLGTIMVFVLIGIFVYFAFKERDFLFYSGLVFCFAMHAFFSSFVHHLFIEPRSFWDVFLLRIPFLSFDAIFFYLFIAHRLDLKQGSSCLNKIYKWTSIIGAFLFLPFYFSEQLSVKVLSAAGTSLMLLLFALVVILHAKRNKHPVANSLLISMSILIISGIITSSIWILAPEQEKFGRIGYIGLFAFATSLLYSLFNRITTIRFERLKTQIEKEKSEELLFNVLPAKIALELKSTGKSDASLVENVSVLFTDFKGFTKLSEALSAKQLVDELQFCFEAFDAIVEEYDIEKIKTIGDAYMAAGGLPVPSETSTKNTVLAALKMQDIILQRQIAMDTLGRPSFQMRIGIHTGSIVAGVIGVKRYQYDIWGNTVNIAARMESTGEIGKVNISHATYELLKDDPAFLFENRGKIKTKGKGEMKMYFARLKKET